MNLSQKLRISAGAMVSRIMPVWLLNSRNHFRCWEQRGLHIVRAGFYSPIPVVAELDMNALAKRRYSFDPAGWCIPAQLQLIEMCRRSEAEMKTLDQFIAAHGSIKNGYNDIDQVIYFGMLRHINPKRIIEVGAGRSTLIASCALRMGNLEDGDARELISIEPFPKSFITRGVKGPLRLIPKRLQDVPVSMFEALDDGDVLFIDSSHVCKAGSDVQWLFSEIMPRLRAGVTVHFHDVFLPYEYPIEWIRDRRRFWNEQYLLQAFLAMNSAYQVVLASYFLSRDYSDEFQSRLGVADGGRPASFWIRRCG